MASERIFRDGSYRQVGLRLRTWRKGGVRRRLAVNEGGSVDSRSWAIPVFSAARIPICLFSKLHRRTKKPETRKKDAEDRQKKVETWLIALGDSQDWQSHQKKQRHAHGRVLLKGVRLRVGDQGVDHGV